MESVLDVRYALPLGALALAGVVAWWQATRVRRCPRHSRLAGTFAWGLALLCATVGVITLGGCASAPTPAGERVAYLCDDGRGFKVTYRPDSRDALVDLSGMRFVLDRTGADARGEHFACDVLTLSRQGETARLDMQGERFYVGCRARR